MKKVIIIGGGTAGTMMANALAKGMGEEIKNSNVSVTMISNQKEHLYQPGLLYIPFGLKTEEEIIRPVKEVVSPLVQIVFDEAIEFSTESKQVKIKSGQIYSYDYLVIATGSRPAVEEVPGLEEAGHIFYTLDGAKKLQKAMEQFEGGNVVMAVGLPHKCPVAPLEFTMMFEDWAREKGIREKTNITYCYPLQKPYGTESVAKLATKEFTARNINIETFFMIDHVDPERKELVSLDDTRIPFDLLVMIPPHKGANVTVKSSLTDNDEGWLPTDRQYLNHLDHDNIFVIGDATNLPISKAGSTAHFEVEILAENLTSIIRGGQANKRYNGKVFCFIETGLHKATYIAFNYDQPPKPVTPSKAVHWAKLSYNNAHWINLKGIL